MLKSRHEQVLKAIVEEYILTIEPISSNTLCDLLEVSSATIRNDMTVLEKYGFIAKNHFASGRIPTEAGYRYYVEFIMNHNKLNDDDSIRLQNIFSNTSIALKDAMFESVKLITELTNYSVVMLGVQSKDERLKEVKVVSIDSHSVVSIIVTSSGKVFHQYFDISEEIDLEELNEVVATINNLLVDTPISEVTKKLEFEIKPVLKKFIDQHSVLCEFLLNSLVNLSSNQEVIHEGKDNLFFQPEFNDVEKIRKAIKKLNDETILQLINYTEEISVKIGKENLVLDDLSIITTSYKDGSEQTNIAVIGPQRMDYEKVVGLLKAIKHNLDRLNKEDVGEQEK